MGNKGKGIEEQRHVVLTQLGLINPKKKYLSPLERQQAAKLRAQQRRAEQSAALAPYGLAPKKKVRRTPEEKKKARSRRAKKHREFLRWAAVMHPTEAKQFGLDLNRLTKNK